MGADWRGGEKMSLFKNFKDPDRIEKDKMSKMTFYGYDNDDCTTDWYDKNGNIDCITPTPHDDFDDDF